MSVFPLTRNGNLRRSIQSAKFLHHFSCGLCPALKTNALQSNESLPKAERSRIRTVHFGCRFPSARPCPPSAKVRGAAGKALGPGWGTKPPRQKRRRPAVGAGLRVSVWQVGQAYFFLSRSRISPRSFSSALGSGAGAGAAGASSSVFFILLMPLTSRNMNRATRTKSMTVVMKSP